MTFPKPGEAQSMVQQVIQTFSGLDYLVNNAGVSCAKAPIPSRDLDRLTEDFWNAILTTNLVGPFSLCEGSGRGASAVARCHREHRMRPPEFILAGSSMAYSASKAGLINLTKNLARGLAPEVRVNAVAPGVVDTGWNGVGRKRLYKALPTAQS